MNSNTSLVDLVRQPAHDPSSGFESRDRIVHELCVARDNTGDAMATSQTSSSMPGPRAWKTPGLRGILCMNRQTLGAPQVVSGKRSSAAPSALLNNPNDTMKKKSFLYKKRRTTTALHHRDSP